MNREERFHSEPYWRPARRGYGNVRDGWLIHDKLTGATARVDLKGDIEVRINAVLERERKIIAGDPLTYRGDFAPRAGIPNAEVYFYDVEGVRLGYILVLRAEAHERVSAWLAEHELTDVRLANGG